MAQRRRAAGGPPDRYAAVAEGLAGSQLGDFVVGRKIGGKDVSTGAAASQTATMHGVCSHVYSVTSRRGGTAREASPFALKVMINLYGDQTGAMEEQFSAEYELLADCARLPRHPNIICALHSFNDLAAGRLPGWDFDPRDVSSRTTFVVMPLCDGGDLKNLINRHCSAGTRVQEPVLRSLLRQLCLAVAHLKAHRISHRDIKPDNVMLRQAPLVAGGEQEQQVVLIDFGQCMDFGLAGGVGFRFPLQFPLPRGGAPGFLAPEIATPKPGLDYAKNDDWAVGMLLHALLSAPVQAQPFSCGEDPKSFADELFLPVDVAAGLV